MQEQFHNISVRIYEQLGIEIPASQIRFEVYNNPYGSLSRIKLELTTDEKIVLKPEERDVYPSYGDTPNDPIIIIQSYCLEEIFAEKLRALIERLRSRHRQSLENILGPNSPVSQKAPMHEKQKDFD